MDEFLKSGQHDLTTEIGKIGSEIDRRRLLTRAAALAVGATVLGNAAVANAGTTRSAAAGAGRRRTQVDKLVVALAGNILALNPDGPGQNNVPSFTAYYACYDALTNYGWPLKLAETQKKLAVGLATLVTPQLATSWTSSKGNTVWRFNLRKGVMSQYGNELSADDVVWSIQKSLAAKATGAFIAGVVGGIGSPDAVKAIDKYTVEFTLAFPTDRVLLAVGWGGGGAPVVYDSVEAKKHATAKDPWANEWLNKNTAGYGRYTLKSMTPGGTSATFEARDDYWGAKPGAKTVIQQATTDSGSRLQLLLTGATQFSADLSIVQLDQVTKSPKAKVVHVDSSTAAFLPLTLKAPWNDPKIRMAIAQAIPYDDILKSVFRGRAKPYQSILPGYLPESTNKFAIKTDYDAAKAVLSTVTTPLTLAYSDGLTIDEQIALLVQQGLKKAGFNLTLQKQPVGEFSTKRFTQGNEFFVDNLATPGVPAVDYYFELYCGKGGFFNFYKWTTPAFEAALAKTKSASKAARAAGALAGQKEFMANLPFIPVAWNGGDYAIAKTITIPFANTANGLVWWRDFRTA